jgi:iron complex outermembrane receptor protein
MPPSLARLLLIASSCLPCAPLLAQPKAPKDGQKEMATIVISAVRTAQSDLDVPAAVDVVDVEALRLHQPAINASEALARVPGVVALNRQNYAQDLQISSRGFGARSAFGVRGVRLIADGIPASMPDGQGQAATFDLDSADRIEVLRGPFSSLYGNHAGGTILLTTRTGKLPPSIAASVMAGSDGQRKLDVQAQGIQQGLTYLLDTSRFRTDGYRDHSAATRDQANAKLTWQGAHGATWTLLANGLRQSGTQDPLGVTWATFVRDPRAGEVDASDTLTPKRTLAERYNTRKSIDHYQAGLKLEQPLAQGRLHAVVYGGNRRVIQFQSIPRAAQAAPTQSGGVIDFQRDFHGADIHWQANRQLAGGTLRTIIGLEAARSSDDRQGYENFSGAELGVQGRLRRDEQDTVTSVDPYVQAEWTRHAWSAHLGLRHTSTRVRVGDRYVSNGDDSGGTRFSRTTPLAGALYRLTRHDSLYASVASGFETPTLNELFYSGSGRGFNFGLNPATSRHMEAGWKHAESGATRINTALFETRTRDELVVDVASGGRTSYRNAARTRRQGLEVSYEQPLAAGWNVYASASWLHAVYREAFASVPSGAQLPGVPKRSLFTELAWTSESGRLGAAVEGQASSRIFADDANRDVPAPGYGILNARVNIKHALGAWRLSAYARVNNLLDRQYVGSLIVGDSNKRYYEAALDRSWVAGMGVQYVF